VDLQQLSDRAEILDCMHRYARGMDRHDRVLARSAYHDDAIDDHLAYSGPVDGFLDYAFDYNATFVRHQHYIANHSAEIDGDEAHAETYFVFVGTDRAPEAPLTVFGGRYVDRLDRRGGRWAISARRCLVEWSTNLASLLPAEGLGVGGTVARDRTDASYERPLIIPDR
jgi:SnoaL-like domain